MAYINVNPNPKGSYVGDCVIRALCIAFNEPWNEVYVGVCIEGYLLCDMPSSNKVWGEYLKNRGYVRHMVPSDCPGCYSVRDFCSEFFKGTYILGTGTHVLTVIDGNYYDTWDSGDEQPIYYWTKEE